MIENVRKNKFILIKIGKYWKNKMLNNKKKNIFKERFF